MKAGSSTKITTSDIVLWLQLPGRTDICVRHAEVIRPYRKAVTHAGKCVTLNMALKLEKSVFAKKRQAELLVAFNALAPYKLVAEIAIYHPAHVQVAYSQLTPRISNCLSALGAQLHFASYISS
jgi:hypothetical protein